MAAPSPAADRCAAPLLALLLAGAAPAFAQAPSAPRPANDGTTADISSPCVNEENVPGTVDPDLDEALLERDRGWCTHTFDGATFTRRYGG